MPVTEQMKNDIYARFHDKVEYYIWSKVGDRNLAEDLCSDVFLKVYEKLESYDSSKAALSTWIYTIARNRLTDYYRTRRVYAEIPETMPSELSVEETVCSRESLEALADALEKLDTRARSIIILRYYSGKTFQEIAERLHISNTYVKTLHKRALAELQEYLKI